MAENFDLIFGQNASQQYAWNDTDYQNGWGTIGNIPPTAAQFDALQRRSDTKMKELNDELTPLVNADTADSRQPSTTYSEGDIKYSTLLPTGWFLTCTTAGITSAGEIVLPTPIADGDTVTDGEAVWEIHKIGTGNGGDGAAVGDIKAIAYNGTIQQGWLLCDGSAVSRTMYPDLFAAIGTTYGAGDGSVTFNVPDYNTAKRFAQGSTVAGTVKQAGLPNIEGSSTQGFAAVGGGSSGDATGAISLTQTGGYTWNTGASPMKRVDFDASRSNPIYGNSTTVQPNALTCRYIIKAFDGQTPDSALIDITQYANELAGKATRALDNLTQAGQDSFLERDFTIIYPNGGTEANPANVTVNSRYVELNPFPGYYVGVMPQLYYNGQWGDTLTYILDNTDSNGINAGMLDDKIVIQTGTHRVIVDGSGQQGDLFGRPAGTGQTTLPCRVKVWKIGKIPTE